MRAIGERLIKSAKRLIVISVVALFAYPLSGYAQRVVKGVVTDQGGEPLPGVTVIVKGSKLGTSTDLDGVYTINAPENGTLTFSYVGKNNQSVKINGRTEVNVVLKDDATNLDEIVVVGYGQQKKIHMTGAVVSVGAKDIAKTTVSNATQALVGKLPGMITQQSGGRPGADGVSILVRGYSSYNDAGTVLTIIDGVTSDVGMLGALDPSDIESISVLKDAASCAMYGMKGSNGVILVTTKKGSEGKATINYRGSVTLSHATSLPRFMNGVEYMAWYNQARRNDGLEDYWTPEEIAMVTNGDPTDGYENTDWTSPLRKTTLMHQHNLSISGGTKRTSYYVSGGYMSQDGILKDYNYQRGNFRSNIESQISDMFKIQFNVSGLVQDTYVPTGHSGMSGGGYGSWAYGSPESIMMASYPFVPKEYNGLPTGAYRLTNGANPEYSVGNSGFSKTRNVKLITAGRIDWEAPFLKGLKASMFVSWDYKNSNSKSFAYPYTINQYNPVTKSYKQQAVTGFVKDGNLYKGSQTEQTVILRPSISFDRVFDDVHSVSALFLYEQSEYRGEKISASRQKFPLYDIADIDFGQTIDAKSGNSGSFGKTATAGFAGRVNYAYDDRYLAEFAFRYDGSYLFAPGKRWGFFPSGSLGWVISQEDWFKDATSNIDRLKIRASVGMTGNDNVTAFLYRKFYGFAENSVAFGTNPTAMNTLYQTVAYPQSDLTWEKTTSTNIGADLTMWNGLMSIEADYFYKYTRDILQGVGGAYAPSLAGNYPSVDNTGRFDSQGFEFVIRHTNRVGKFLYSVNANVTYAHNRILRRTQSDGTLPWQSVLGGSIGDIYGLKALGLYQTQEQLDNMPYPINNKPSLGDIMYEDIDGDGRITSNDRVKIARGRRPELMFALNADANYQGFDLSFQIQGAALTDLMLGSGMSDYSPIMKPFYANWDNAPLHLVEDSWTENNRDAKYPRLSLDHQAHINNAYISSFWKRNGAYVRLKNVTIGYTLPKRIVSKAGISNLRIYASGYNLLTFTEYKYHDPEGQNYVRDFYPQQRTFSFGIDLSF